MRFKFFIFQILCTIFFSSCHNKSNQTLITGNIPNLPDGIMYLCKDNNLKKYGVDSFSKTNEFKAKVAKTWDEKTDEEKLAHKEKSRQIRANDPVFECPHCNKIVKGKTLYNDLG